MSITDRLGVDLGEAKLLIMCVMELADFLYVEVCRKRVDRKTCEGLVFGLLSNSMPMPETKKVQDYFKKIIIVASIDIPLKMGLHVFLAEDGGKIVPVYREFTADLEMVPDAPSIYPHETLWSWLLYPHTVPCKCLPSYMDGRGVCKACEGTKEVRSVFGHREITKKMWMAGEKVNQGLV